VLHLVGGDERIATWWQEVVSETLQEIEAVTATRVRRGGQDHDRRTGHLVAAIVKLDDVGLHLNRSQSALARRLGAGLLVFAPWLMKALSVVGTAAMFMVGGGILVHGWPLLHHAVEALDHNLLALPGGAVWSSVGNALAGALVGVVAGAAVLGMFTLAKRLRPSA